MGLESTLDNPSISQVSAYGLFATLAFCMMSNATAMVATSLLWRSKWYENIQIKLGEFVGWFLTPWMQGLGWFSFTICLSVSTFLFVERFVTTTKLTNPSSNPGDFNWVYGWLFVSNILAYMTPVIVYATGNFWAVFFLTICMETSIAVSFGYMIRYATNNSGHFSLHMPGIWVLLWPVLWGLIMTGITAFIAYYDDDSEQSKIKQRSTVSESLLKQADPTGMNAAAPVTTFTRNALLVDPNPSSKFVVPINTTQSQYAMGQAVPKAQSEASLSEYNNGSNVSGRHNKSSKGEMYTYQ
jgi:hypothetical protein